MKSILTAAVMLGMACGAQAADFGDLAVSAAGLRERAAEAGAAAAVPAPAKVPTVSTATPAGSDFERWWEKFKDDTEDDICKAAQLKLKQNARLVQVLGVGGLFGRSLKQLPNGQIALLDEVGVNLGVTVGNNIIPLPVEGLGVSLGAQVEGQSQVVRPLAGTRYCQEIKEWAKLWEVKTALPLKARRISEMETGEIWKLPLTLKMSFSASIGTTVNQLVNISIGAGTAYSRRPSVTLYRMAGDKLRLRLRLDRVTAFTAGASVKSADIPMEQLSYWQADNILAGFVNKTVASEINKFISTQLSYGYSKNFGKKLLLEFTLDPRDEAQMKALEEFLRGDLGIIKRFVELGLEFNDFSASDDSASGLGELSAVSEHTLESVGGKPTFSGSDLYNGSAHNFHFQVPVVNAHDVSWSASYHRYQSVEKKGETLHVQQRTRRSDSKTLSVPFMGANVKHNSERTFYVVNREGLDGRASAPALMYQQNEGIVKHTDGSARDMVGQANGVLKYVGMRGEGVNEAETLPVKELFPDSGGAFKTYKTVAMNFSVLISERGLQQILTAPAEVVMKAYLSVMREYAPKIVDKVRDLFRVDGKGDVSYDAREVSIRLGGMPTYEDPVKPEDMVRQLAIGAEGMIRDLMGLRGMGNWKDQSAALTSIATGRSHSGLGYEDFLKVAVQLTDPLNVSAKVYVNTNKKVKGEKDYSQTYEFFNDRENSFDSNIAEVREMQSRFADPSDLTD